MLYCTEFVIELCVLSDNGKRWHHGNRVHDVVCILAAVRDAVYEAVGGDIARTQAENYLNVLFQLVVIVD